MIKKWFEIKTTGPADKAEPVTAFLIELGSAGVLEEGMTIKSALQHTSRRIHPLTKKRRR